MPSLLKIEKHNPVMLTEALKYLTIKENGIYLDCTLGSGGHSQALMKNYPKVKLLIAFDQDQEAIKRCQQNSFFANKEIVFINDNFVNFSQHLTKLNISEVDGFLFDLGLSSNQLEAENRGFSYKKKLDSPLDMRMNLENKLTAEEVINHYPEKRLANIFFCYGEERKNRRIASKIVY